MKRSDLAKVCWFTLITVGLFTSTYLYVIIPLVLTPVNAANNPDIFSQENPIKLPQLKPIEDRTAPSHNGDSSTLETKRLRHRQNEPPNKLGIATSAVLETTAAAMTDKTVIAHKGALPATPVTPSSVSASKHSLSATSSRGTVATSVIAAAAPVSHPSMTTTTTTTTNQQQKEQQPILLSMGKPATSDVQGNLGPASVITSEVITDWLKDRWQAASDMSGTPIRGQHWLEIDLQDEGTSSSITKILIDWEDAYSDRWVVQGKQFLAEESWTTLAESRQMKVRSRAKHHIIQEVILDPRLQHSKKIRYIRLLIHSPSTKWGSSVWRFQVWGLPSTL